MGFALAVKITLLEKMEEAWARFRVARAGLRHARLAWMLCHPGGKAQIAKYQEWLKNEKPGPQPPLLISPGPDSFSLGFIDALTQFHFALLMLLGVDSSVNKELFLMLATAPIKYEELGCD